MSSSCAIIASSQCDCTRNEHTIVQQGKVVLESIENSENLRGHEGVQGGSGGFSRGSDLLFNTVEQGYILLRICARAYPVLFGLWKSDRALEYTNIISSPRVF